MSLNIPECPEDNTEDNNYNFSSKNSELNRLSNDLFLSILNLPKCIRKHSRLVCGDIRKSDVEDLQLSIRNFTIPAINIPTHKKAFNGATRSESSKTVSEYEDITIQFKVDNQMVNYGIIYNWLQMLRNPEDGADSGFGKVDYETTFSVLILDEYEKPVGMYTFEGVVPVTLGSISLDYAANEQIFVDFTFSFDFISFTQSPN